MTPGADPERSDILKEIFVTNANFGSARLQARQP
jgi:hypothetical protein